MKNKKTLVIALYFTVLFVTLVIASMLFMQYRYFKNEAQELSQVKESYYQHVEMLKRSLNASMAQNDEEESGIDPEKKKIVCRDRPNSLSLGLQPEPSMDVNFIVEIDEQKAAAQFQLINTQEDAQLKSKKASIAKIGPAKILAARVLRRSKRAKKAKRVLPVRSVRYAPIRDFDFSWPLELSSFWLSSLFGPRKRPNGHVEFHHAIDMAALRGTPVKAAAGGKVILAQMISGYGNCIMIEHNSRYKTRYAHLHRIMVRQGQIVQDGDLIGMVGDTGLVRSAGRDASHLHFEIYQDGYRVNPLIFLFN